MRNVFLIFRNVGEGLQNMLAVEKVRNKYDTKPLVFGLLTKAGASNSGRSAPSMDQQSR
jgi:hypothetical protein